MAEFIISVFNTSLFYKAKYLFSLILSLFSVYKEPYLCEKIYAGNGLNKYEFIYPEQNALRLMKTADLKFYILSTFQVLVEKSFLDFKYKIDLISASRCFYVPAEIILALYDLESGGGAAYQGRYYAYDFADSGNKAAIKKICKEVGCDPKKVKGSKAGAILPGFMPITWRKYAIDADFDSKRDPWSKTDAIFTFAHYLFKNDWQKDQKKAIFTVNHSQKYVNYFFYFAKKKYGWKGNKSPFLQQK